MGELAGLATVCLLLPELSASTSMLDAAVAGLAQEADRQILPDGAGAEQAVSYQMFTVELLALVVILLWRNGVRVPREMTSALARSGRYLASIVGADDPDPRYGDDDDGFAIRLGPDPAPSHDHLAIIAAVLPDAGFARWGTTNLTSASLRESLATDLGSGDVGTRDQAAGSCFAPDGGLVVLFQSKKRRLTMDVGPLGYRQFVDLRLCRLLRSVRLAMATLRNFPSRQELLETLYADEVDAIVAAAGEVALVPWLRRLFAFLHSKHPIGMELLDLTAGDTAVLDGGRDRVLAAGAPLVAAAQASGEVRDDLTLDQILSMVKAIAKVPGDPEYVEPILQRPTLDGLRPRRAPRRGSAGRARGRRPR